MFFTKFGLLPFFDALYRLAVEFFKNFFTNSNSGGGGSGGNGGTGGTNGPNGGTNGNNSSNGTADTSTSNPASSLPPTTGGAGS